jgi:[CysO sulfur-carrier protein]-S-L-cysteine hydrolase
MDGLRLNREQLRTIIEHVWSNRAHETCGLIAGEGDVAKLVLPMPNKADDPKRHFWMDETALLKALREIDTQKLRLLAIYHSHPTTEPVASPEDVEAARQYPNVLHVIISLKYSSPRLKAWRIEPGQVEAIDVLTDGRVPDGLRNETLSTAQKYAILLAALLAFALMLGLSLSLLPPAPMLTPTGFR